MREFDNDTIVTAVLDLQDGLETPQVRTRLRAVRSHRLSKWETLMNWTRFIVVFSLVGLISGGILAYLVGKADW